MTRLPHAQPSHPWLTPHATLALQLASPPTSHPPACGLASLHVQPSCLWLASHQLPPSCPRLAPLCATLPPAAHFPPHTCNLSACGSLSPTCYPPTCSSLPPMCNPPAHGLLSHTHLSPTHSWLASFCAQSSCLRLISPARNPPYMACFPLTCNPSPTHTTLASCPPPGPCFVQPAPSTANHCRLHA